MARGSIGGDEQCLPNPEIVVQYLYIFSTIYLVTQNIRNILQLPQRSYEIFEWRPYLILHEEEIVATDFF